MQIPRFFCLLALTVSFISVDAQNSVATSREPEKKKVYFAPHAKVKKVRKPNVKHTQRYEYYERVEKAAREKQRILKKLSKAQFSDPRYFGHKRIPKRKPFFKMRYCNECGIRH